MTKHAAILIGLSLLFLAHVVVTVLFHPLPSDKTDAMVVGKMVVEEGK